MAVTHWIGPFPFVTLEGEVAVPKRRVDVLTRQGVDGVGVFVHGLLASTFAAYIILVLVAVASWLMVSRIRFPHINYFVRLLKRK